MQRRRLFEAVMLTGATLAGPALAQDTGDRAQSATIEEVVVSASPIRDSQQAALQLKRDADNFIDVVSADTIGRFPDQNLADSLARLPGVAVERDQGQARYLNLRGAPFRYTGIAFDGIDVPGAENGRIPRFDSFPATITSQVIANKAILPSMPGESVSGYIDIRTFNPFDVEGVSLALDVGQGEQDLGGGDVERRSVRASWSNERFGVVGFFSNNRREQITDNREYDLGVGDGGELIVNELDFRSYFVNREDTGWGGRAEYRGSGPVETVFLSTLYTEFVDEEERTQWVFASADPQPGVRRDGVPLVVNRLLQDGRYENSTSTTTLGSDLRFGAWRMEARVNYTETEYGFRLPIPFSAGGFTLGSYDVSDREDPLLTLAQPLTTIEFPLTLALDVATRLDIEAVKYKLDLERDLDLLGQDTTFRAGVQFDQRESGGFALNQGLDFGFPVADINRFATDRPWESNTTNSIEATYYDNVGLREAWAATGALGEPDPSQDQLVAIDEDILALYAMATTRFDWGNIVYGVRVEQTDYESSGPAGGQPLSVSGDFLNVLPSAHLNIDLAEDVKFRLSATSGVNRPTYNEWRAAASVNVSDQEINGGNPFLDAEEAFGADLSLEWYFATASILSFGAFHREIDNVIYTDVTFVDAGLYLPSAAGQQWRFNGAANGDNGRLTGAELNFMISAVDYLPGALGGLGFSTNVTVIDSQFETLDGRELGLPGTSDLIYNASIFYENYGLSLRLNYQYRDDWISPIEDPSEFWGEMERVDATLLYELPMDFGGARASVYANLNNLTDETDVRFAGNGTINQSESFGLHYMLGFRINY